MPLNLDVIRYEMEEAMRKIGEKHGFSATIGAITYSDIGFHCSVNALVDSVGNGKSGAQVEYETYARKFDIDPSTFGKHFVSDGKEFVIVGINKKARTLPVLAKEITSGQMYKFSPLAAKVHVALKLKDVETIKYEVNE